MSARILIGSTIAAGLVAGGALVSCSSDDDVENTMLVPRPDGQLVFDDPADCAECHEQHVAEWEISNHAYAVADPVFAAMVKMGQEATKGKLGNFCVQCHSPVGMAAGLTEVFEDTDGVWKQDLETLDPIARKGVSCDVCHSITEVIEPANAKMVFTPDGTKRSTIADPVVTDAHESAYSELHASSDLCGSCHAVINPKGAEIEETFFEWEVSPAAAEGKQCQDCHMPEYTGRAAPDAPERTLHRHTFVGVDVSLLPEDEFPGYQEMRDLTATLLQEATEMQVTADGANARIDIAIENLAGHAVPSGATAERQMWIDLIVTDTATGQVVFSSGQLDENGDIFTGVAETNTNPGSDPQLVYFGQQMISIDGFADMDDAAKAAARAQIDESCVSMGQGAILPNLGFNPVSFPWQADWQCNYLIPPGGTHNASFDLSSLPSGTYDVSLKLKFRTFPIYFLKKLEVGVGLDPEVKTRLPIVTMQESQLSITIP